MAAQAERVMGSRWAAAAAGPGSPRPPPFTEKPSEAVTNLPKDQQMSHNWNFCCVSTYNYQPFVPVVSARRRRRRSQFGTRAAAAAAALRGRVGGLMWNRNHIPAQLGADLFVSL